MALMNYVANNTIPRLGGLWKIVGLIHDCLYVHLCDDRNAFLISAQLLSRITQSIHCTDYDYGQHSAIFISASLTMLSEVLLCFYHH